MIGNQAQGIRFMADTLFRFDRNDDTRCSGLCLRREALTSDEWLCPMPQTRGSDLCLICPMPRSDLYLIWPMPQTMREALPYASCIMAYGTHVQRVCRSLVRYYRRFESRQRRAYLDEAWRDLRIESTRHRESTGLDDKSVKHREYLAL